MRYLLIALVSAATVYGGTGSIVASFYTPCGNGVYGIDYHAGYIYHTDTAYNIVYTTTTTGSVVSSFSFSATGIDRTSIEFWMSHYRTPTISRLTTTGSFIRSFASPAAWGCGIAYGEGFLWLSGYKNDVTRVYKLTVNGSLVSSFTVPTGTAGICYDAGRLWTADYAASTLRQYTTTGSLVDTLRAVAKPTGVTVGGGFLWYPAVVHVYQVDFSPTIVAPASLGKVKALYRP